MYSVEHNNIFIALVATSFGHHGPNQANAIQKKNVAHKNVKLYEIPFT
jgi:hypothetical protein